VLKLCSVVKKPEYRLKLIALARKNNMRFLSIVEKDSDCKIVYKKNDKELLSDNIRTCNMNYVRTLRILAGIHKTRHISRMPHIFREQLTNMVDFKSD
jgi:hypothetical protein